MTKKIKDLTETEIHNICKQFNRNCERMICEQLIGVCPLKTGVYFGKCVLNTKAWKVANREVEVKE